MTPASREKLPPVIRLFASLELTLVCLAFGVFLIFWGTLEQARLGIDQAVDLYFRSWFVFVGPAEASWKIPIMPGGFLIGAILLINLLAAHVYRFHFSVRKIGIWLIHVGLIVLLLGELVTAMFQRDSFMRITEGETKAYSEMHEGVEIAIIDRTDPATDKVVAIPESALRPGAVVQDPHLPFRVEVRGFVANSDIFNRTADSRPTGTPEATQGMGTRYTVRPAPLTVNPEERNLPVGWVEFIGTEGSLGTWMVSDAPIFQGAQTFTYEGRTFAIDLRPQRLYKPFALTLLDFTHDRYPGTDKPRDFASQVRLVDPRHGEDREVRIYMNHPLRYDGLTFYQHSFEVGDTTTILQVVQNPGRHLPYISCILVGLGLLTQFGMHLFSFSKRGSGAPVAARRSRLPWVVAGSAAALVAFAAFRPEASDRMHWREFGELPVLVGGRIKPLDTVARTSLLVIHDKQSLSVPLAAGEKISPFKQLRFKMRAAFGGDGTPVRKLPAIEWLAEVLFTPAQAAERKVFTIHDPQVLDLFGWKQDGTKYFSYAQLQPHAAEIVRQANLANDVTAQLRTRFQRHILELYHQVSLFQKLRNSLQPEDATDFAGEIARFGEALPALQQLALQSVAGKAPPDEAQYLQVIAARYDAMARIAYIRVVPPADSATERERTEFMPLGASVLRSLADGALHPAVQAYTAIGAAYRAGDIGAFNSALTGYETWLETRYAPELAKTAQETFFNRYAPFYLAMVIYVAVFVLGCVSWLTGPGAVRRTAYLLTGLALVIHTSGIVFRMWIEGRPPVTNLYSSAVFVGFVAVIVAFVLERIFRNAIGSVVAGVIGFCTLLIAHHLSFSGDTLEMMQAVLDSNFWLATHVVVITVGYGATFLAGFLGLFYIGLGVFSRYLQPDLARSLNRMTYGVLCFATLCSFVGTVLGGIWADQSWGRFWGWDPKENGAALIVLWNAIILHARWGGFIRQRGLAVMAVFGNAVTAWSWFGTNMLGIGLHSYGFMDKAFIALLAFVGFNLVMMLVAGLPLERWRSPMPAKTPPPLSPEVAEAQATSAGTAGS